MADIQCVTDFQTMHGSNWGNYETIESISFSCILTIRRLNRIQLENVYKGMLSWTHGYVYLLICNLFSCLITNRT